MKKLKVAKIKNVKQFQNIIVNTNKNVKKNLFANLGKNSMKILKNVKLEVIVKLLNITVKKTKNKNLCVKKMKHSMINKKNV